MALYHWQVFVYASAGIIRLRLDTATADNAVLLAELFRLQRAHGPGAATLHTMSGKCFIAVDGAGLVRNDNMTWVRLGTIRFEQPDGGTDQW